MLRRYKISINDKARHDIFRCAEYIYERSFDHDIAMMWEESIYDRIKQLDSFPTSYPAFNKGPYRKMLHGRYIILFKIDEIDFEVVVCRVIHSSRLIDNAGPLE